MKSIGISFAWIILYTLSAHGMKPGDKTVPTTDSKDQQAVPNKYLNTPLYNATITMPSSITIGIEECKALIERGADVTTQNYVTLRTPLDNVLLFWSIKGVRELSPLLLKRRAPASVLRRIRVKGILTPLFEAILADNRQDAFCTALPSLLCYGMNPYEQDLQGNTVLHYVVNSVAGYMKLMHDEPLLETKGTRAADILHALVLESQKVQDLNGALTVLAIHKFRTDSLIALLPKVVVRFVLIPLIIRPYKNKRVEDCVTEQLKILAKLLAIKNNNENTPFESLPVHARATLLCSFDNRPITERKKRIINIRDLFDPNKIEEHREDLTMLTYNAIAHAK